MKELIKKIFTNKCSVIYVFVVSALIFCLCSVIVSAQNAASIPDYLRLKVSNGQILGNKKVAANIIKYAYNSGKRVSADPSKSIFEQAQKNGLSVGTEVLEERTGHSRTFKTNNPDKFITEIISGDPQYYKDIEGQWWEANYATTTEESFIEQTKVGFLDGFLGRDAYATSNVFYPDAGASFPVDGDIRVDELGSTWATEHARISGNLADATYGTVRVYIQYSSGVGNWNIARGVTVFDTSSIPDSNIISSAKASIFVKSINNDDPDGKDYIIPVKGVTLASDDNLVVGDFDGIGAVSSPLAIANSLDLDSVVDEQYNDFTLTDLTDISKTGNTRIGWRIGHDAENEALTHGAGDATEGVSFSSADESGTAQDPKLIVVHYTHTELYKFTNVRKGSNESVSSSISLQDDDELFLTLEANKSYVVSGSIFADSASADPDIKIAFVLDPSTGVTMDLGYIASTDSSLNTTGALLESSGSGSSGISLTGSNSTIIKISGTVEAGNSATTLKLQWAQNSSSATDVTVKEGSYLGIVEI